MRMLINKRGVTLVETMVSVLLFLLVGGAVLNVCVQSSMTGKRSEVAFTAYNLAKNHIDELRNLPFSSLPNATETETSLNEAGVADPDGTFLRSTSVSANFSGNPNLTRVNVSVDYFVRGHQSANPMSLTTVIYEYA
jgi:Tfp pilus assembly protein PilV